MILLNTILFGMVSMAGTIAVSMNMVPKVLRKLADKGYKLKRDEFESYKDKVNEKNNNEKKSYKGIYMLIPGVNLICAVINTERFVNKAVNLFDSDEDLKKLLLPMTEQEKESYAKLKGRREKAKYLIFLSAKEHEEDEIVGFYGNNIIVHDAGEITLKDKIDGEYSLEEVQELTKNLDARYKIGIIGNDPIAVIMPKDYEKDFKRVRFDDMYSTFDFVERDEEYTQGMKFSIYPTYEIDYNKESNITISEEKIVEENCDIPLNNTNENIKNNRVLVKKIDKK